MVEVEEKWVVVEGFYPYAVSNFGNVENSSRGHELKLQLHKRTGKYFVMLYKDGERYQFFIHRLVAEAFFLNYQEGCEVVHNNGDFSDNGVFNLSLGRGAKEDKE